MWNEPSKERLGKIPKLYATENTPLPDTLQDSKIADPNIFYLMWITN